MTIDFSIGAQALGAAVAGQQTHESGPKAGSFMGHAAVMVESPMSLLADAAEELTFAADTTDEYELSERKEKDKVDKSLAERVQLYKELMHQAGKAKDIENLGRNLHGVSDKNTAKQQALRQFPDPSDAFTALGSVLEDLQAQGAAPESVEAVKGAMDDLEAELGPQIRAGIQGALEAAGRADLAEPDELRGLYRQTVCEFTSVNELFNHIHEKYGTAGFEKALDFLYAALGADLASDLPSMGKNHLESVNTSLGQMRLLQSAHAQCERLLNRWETIHGASNAKGASFTSMDLLGDIVALRKEKFPGAAHIERIAAKAQAPDIEREVLFLQEVLTMTRGFPPTLFDGEAGRMKIIDAAQEAVDRAVEREDAYLASLE